MGVFIDEGALESLMVGIVVDECALESLPLWTFADKYAFQSLSLLPWHRHRHTHLLHRMVDDVLNIWGSWNLLLALYLRQFLKKLFHEYSPFLRYILFI